MSCTDLSVTFESQAGTSYVVFCYTNLVAGTWAFLETTTAAGPSTTVTDPNAGVGPARFYRIEVR